MREGARRDVLGAPPGGPRAGARGRPAAARPDLPVPSRAPGPEDPARPLGEARPLSLRPEDLIFVDTGPFVAASYEGDKWRPFAEPVWSAIERAGCRLLTTDLVLAEAASLLARSGLRSEAAQVVRRIHGSKITTLVRRSRDDDEAALEILEPFPARDVSFVDCVSFLVARRAGATLAFTFDYDHFPAAGFEVVPRRPAKPPR